MRPTHDSDCAIHNMPASPSGPCNCSRSKSKEQPTFESVRALIEQLPRGTIWHTQIDELVAYTKLALVKFGKAT